MIIVTVTTVYPTADDRNTTYAFMQENSIAEYITTAPDNYCMTIQDEKMLSDQHTYQIIGHLNYGLQPTIIITIKELVNNECLLSDIYKCEYGKFYINILNKDHLNTEVTLNSNPRVRIKDMYLDYTDDEDGYDDYNVYEIEIVE